MKRCPGPNEERVIEFGQVFDAEDFGACSHEAEVAAAELASALFFWRELNAIVESFVEEMRKSTRA